MRCTIHVYNHLFEVQKRIYIHNICPYRSTHLVWFLRSFVRFRGAQFYFILYARLFFKLRFCLFVEILVVRFLVFGGLTREVENGHLDIWVHRRSLNLALCRSIAVFSCLIQGNKLVVYCTYIDCGLVLLSCFSGISYSTFIWRILVHFVLGTALVERGWCVCRYSYRIFFILFLECAMSRVIY